MAVTTSPKDTHGSLLAANITALTTAVAAMSSALTKAAMSAQLDQLQRELVAHYMDTGRLTAANILSTMS